MIVSAIYARAHVPIQLLFTPRLAARALLAVDLLAWRVVAAMFDRERLVTGIRG